MAYGHAARTRWDTFRGQLLGPLQAMIDDAFTMNADPGRLRQPPAPARLLNRTVCLPRYARTTPRRDQHPARPASDIQ
jgi:hypothetical protein